MANKLVGASRYSNIERSIEIRSKIKIVHDLGISYAKLARESDMNAVNMGSFALGKKDATDFVLDRIEKALEKYKGLL